MLSKDEGLVRPMVKELRVALSLTQERLAGILGVSRQTISGWECGRAFSRKRQDQVKALHTKRVRTLFDKV